VILREEMPDVKQMKPTVEEVQAAKGKSLPDILAPDLDVLFCGINPGLYSAAVDYHFARPGNRFWTALHASGFTEGLLEPHEQDEMLRFGCGLTNLVARATSAAAELSTEELRHGRELLQRKVRRYGPAWVAVLGKGAYRKAFRRSKAEFGQQQEELAGARMWVLPNPSGMNARYQPPALAELFRELREVARS
jgi:TDG/mug DNA glycosylase family protein